VLAVLAAVALLYWKRGVIEVLAASACCGLLISLLRASV
jgi:chromate transporter